MSSFGEKLCWRTVFYFTHTLEQRKFTRTHFNTPGLRHFKLRKGFKISIVRLRYINRMCQFLNCWTRQTLGARVLLLCDHFLKTSSLSFFISFKNFSSKNLVEFEKRKSTNLKFSVYFPLGKGNVEIFRKSLNWTLYFLMVVTQFGG